MNKKLQEFKYDLERETDDEKSYELIEDYVRVKESKDRLKKYGTIDEIERENNKSILKELLLSGNEGSQAIGEADECDCDQCKAINRKSLLEEQNQTAPLTDCDKDIDYLLEEEISESEADARKFHVLFNKAEDDEKNKCCEGKKQYRGDDYNERNREALNGLYGEGKYGKKPFRSDLDTFFERRLKIAPNKIAIARKVLRDAFADDPDFKHSYMANIRMFLNDHADVLIEEQIINDLIDFILR